MRGERRQRFSIAAHQPFSLVKWLTTTIVPPGRQTRRISAANRAGFGTTDAT